MAKTDNGCGGCFLPLILLVIGGAIAGPVGALIGLFIGLALSGAWSDPGTSPTSRSCPQPPWRSPLLAPAHSRGRNVPVQPGAGRPRVARPSEVGKVCPYCTTTIGRSAQVVECPGCGRVYHADCWQDNHGCALYGCRARA